MQLDGAPHAPAPTLTEQRQRRVGLPLVSNRDAARPAMRDELALHLQHVLLGADHENAEPLVWVMMRPVRRAPHWIYSFSDVRPRAIAASQRVEIEPDFRAALESSDPDVILADYNLPRFDGISALNIAHALVPETPFIFVSGSIGEERAAQALREGATDYILKDRLSRLPAAITRALRRQPGHP